jgi:hypothetical protein
MALRHTTLLSAALGAAFMLSSTAEACTLDAWDVNGSIVGTPIPGGPAHTNNTVRRYSGVCGMRSTGTDNYVQNDDPAGDQIFRARFYVYTSNTGTPATIYQAGNGTTAGVVSVTMNGGTQITVTPVGGTAMNFGTTANRWYSVEIAMNATATATTGDDPIAENTVIARVGGGGSDTVNSNTSTITTGSQIDFARLGCVSGCVGNVDFEEYESTRSAGTAIGRLLRGDANGDGFYGGGDVLAVIRELVGASFATGRPDCEENGFIGGADVTCVVRLLVAN